MQKPKIDDWKQNNSGGDTYAHLSLSLLKPHANKLCISNLTGVEAISGVTETANRVMPSDGSFIGGLSCLLSPLPTGHDHGNTPICQPRFSNLL